MPFKIILCFYQAGAGSTQFCLGGAESIARGIGFEPRHLAVELARALSGPDWLGTLRGRVRTAQAVRF